MSDVKKVEWVLSIDICRALVVAQFSKILSVLLYLVTGCADIGGAYSYREVICIGCCKFSRMRVIRYMEIKKGGGNN